ncbi:hypothetical protein GCM10027610_024770 [Dactylosporangium cerinum]
MNCTDKVFGKRNVHGISRVLRQHPFVAGRLSGTTGSGQLDHRSVGIAPDGHRPVPEPPHELKGALWLRAPGEVATEDDQIGRDHGRLAQHGRQRGNVPVHVGKDRHVPHRSVPARGSFAVSRPVQHHFHRLIRSGVPPGGGPGSLTTGRTGNSAQRPGHPRHDASRRYTSGTSVVRPGQSAAVRRRR